MKAFGLHILYKELLVSLRGNKNVVIENENYRFNKDKQIFFIL